MIDRVNLYVVYYEKDLISNSLWQSSLPAQLSNPALPLWWWVSDSWEVPAENIFLVELYGLEKQLWS